MKGCQLARGEGNPRASYITNTEDQGRFSVFAILMTLSQVVHVAATRPEGIEEFLYARSRHSKLTKNDLAAFVSENLTRDAGDNRGSGPH